MSAIHDLSRHRQVHLDFHTSPLIEGVGADFDAEVFAEQVASAHVGSITLFARCHHGLCYYPSTVAEPHPYLGGRDLMGEQIEALHRRGIRCPLYLTVGWDERMADAHAAWLQRDAAGEIGRVREEDGSLKVGGWRFLNWLHPDYQDFLAAQLDELMGRYDVDGFFFDILTHGPGCDWSPVAHDFRAQHGLLADTPEAAIEFEVLAQVATAERFSAQIRARLPGASIFYNTFNRGYVDHRWGVHGKVAQQSHTEVESLPTGEWGYHHFPRLARQMMHLDVPWLGMTGRFQKSWGDFGGIKPVPALEYECFRAQGLGGGVSVGDQMHPRGVLDRGAFALIGEVFAQVKAAESFYAGSQACSQIGVVLAGRPGADESVTNCSEEGAVMLCEELHYDCAVVDDASDLRGFALVVLPDYTPVTPALRERLAAYHTAGGKLLFTGSAGFDEAGQWALDFLPLTRRGGETEETLYWQLEEEFFPGWGETDRVLYRRGPAIVEASEARVWAWRQEPYFQRSDEAFCSHFQAPPRPSRGTVPAIVMSGGWACVSDPMFREYREVGSVVVAEVWQRLVETMIGPPLAGAGLPMTVHSYPRRRGDDLLLTLLHYVPVRKARQIDVVAERMSFAGETLRFDREIGEVHDVLTGETLPSAGEDAVQLHGRGRLLLEVPGFYRD